MKPQAAPSLTSSAHIRFADDEARQPWLALLLEMRWEMLASRMAAFDKTR